MFTPIRRKSALRILLPKLLVSLLIVILAAGLGQLSRVILVLFFDVGNEIALVSGLVVTLAFAWGARAGWNMRRELVAARRELAELREFKQSERQRWYSFCDRAERSSLYGK